MAHHADLEDFQFGRLSGTCPSLTARSPIRYTPPVAEAVPQPITIRALTKRFGKTVAVDDISLDIAAGDLFFLLGPSGCGKTTLLRMIAGFTEPTAGTIRFGEKDVTHLAPNKRNTGMVFQGYALWPHMTVAENVAFGLEVRKVSADEKRRRVNEALKQVQIEDLAGRKTNQLSGGQQQRVALARALVIEPEVLLLDEPLSNLDAKLRLRMRQSIRDICKRAGITAVYVTHDQKEALSMADAVAVLSKGKAMQVGPPRQLYERPVSRFVADFLGETNFVQADVTGRDGDAIVLDSPMGTLRSTVFPADLPKAGSVTCSIRPETLKLVPADGDSHAGAATNTFTASQAGTVYLGELAQYRLAVGDQLALRAYELNPKLLASPDRSVRVQIDPADVVILSD